MNSKFKTIAVAAVLAAGTPQLHAIDFPPVLMPEEYSSGGTPQTRNVYYNGLRTYTVWEAGPDSGETEYEPEPPVDPLAWIQDIVGAMTQMSQINGSYSGALVWVPESVPSVVAFNASAKTGDLYFPGSPTFIGLTSAVLAGEIVPLDGDAQPSNYVVSFHPNARVAGNIYTRINAPAWPSVQTPPQAVGVGSRTVTSGTATVIDPAQYRAVTVTGATTQAALLPGPYQNLTLTGGTVVLGTPGIKTSYSFSQGVTLAPGVKIVLAGPVDLLLPAGFVIPSGATVGDAANPDWLTISSNGGGGINANTGSKLYGQVVAPNGSVSLMGTFAGSVTSKSLAVVGNNVAFTNPPVYGVQEVNE